MFNYFDYCWWATTSTAAAAEFWPTAAASASAATATAEFRSKQWADIKASISDSEQRY